MGRETKQIFGKGINERISKERGSSDRLQTLKNARLQKRGNTLEVSRIEGFEEIANSTADYSGTTVLDSLIYDNDLVVLSHDGTDVNIDFIDLDTGTTVTKSFTADAITYGELTLLEDTIFITPYQKVLTNVSGTWYLKDFISTTPLVEINTDDLGTKATGSITITGPASSPEAATTTMEITAGASASGTIRFTYDGNSVDIEVLNGASIDQIGIDVETAINADGTIGIDCFYDSGTNVLTFTAETIGAGENGKDVTFTDVDTTGVTVGTNPATMSGGISDGTKEGDLDFSINGTVELSYDVKYGDTKLEVANGLNTYLNANSTIYESTVDSGGADPVINIVALDSGTPANGTITEDTNTTAVTYSKVDMTGGAYEAGTLEQDEDYWYKVRYVYFDGHKTKTSYPAYKNTGNHQGTKIDITVAQDDLDGGWINVEIFRKRDTSEYFLIDKITPTSTTETYTDNGKPNLRELQEENYVWAETNQTQEIVRDRLVKANNTYSNVENNIDFFGAGFSSSVDTGEQGLPYNTDVEVYTQVRKKDGTLTAHKFHSTVSTDSTDTKLQTQQTGQYIPTEDFKEFATFARFRPKDSEDVIAFKSLEIYNANVASIATEDEAEADQDKPTNPHVFLGFKYIGGNTSDTDQAIIYDREWNTNPQTPDGSTNLYIKQDAINYNNDLTDLAFYDEAGDELPYAKRAFEDNGTVDTKVYQLAFFDALKEAIANGTCKLKLTGINGVDGSLSSERPDDDFIGREINVVGLKDTSNQSSFQLAVYGVNDSLYYSNYNHLYLILESDTPFDDFDNIGANNSDIKADYETTTPSSFEHRYEFELIGLKEIDNGVSSSNVLASYTTYDYDYRLRLTDYTDVQNEAGVLIHKTSVNSSLAAYTPEIQGWEKTVNNKFEFYTINTWNEYSSIITLEDLEAFQRDYPNQLIWSQPYILESNASKVRTFDYTNVKNISGEYGEIVNIQYILGKLLVFCERGINIINVGEVLTQQVGGQTFVDSSTLLNNDFWLLKNLPDIKPKSIVQHENVLYFCDGKDVWSYSGQMNNITQGKILLDDTNDYVGGIDPRNKEYLLSDGTETFSYSIELGEWQGPYTFDIETSFPHKNNFFGVVGDNAVKFNTGNNLTDTVIESVANTLDEASITKLFRKFYLEMSPTLADGDVTFEYSKDGSTYTSVDLFDKPLKNGVYHVGINGTNKNGRQIYWKITTQKENFVLNLVSFLWDERKRR